jgi:hypothetical protein
MRLKMVAASVALAAVTVAAGLAAPASADPLIPGVSGCGASGDKQAGGAVVGALAGGLLGNSLSGHNRTTGTVLGAAVGAAAGSAVGCQMQHNDEQRAQAAQAAEAPPPAHDERQDHYSLGRGVLPADFHRLDGPLVVTHSVALRASPDSRSRRLGMLHKGERFDAMAEVRGTDWLLVGRNGVGAGYVQRANARPDGDRYADRY